MEIQHFSHLHPLFQLSDDDIKTSTDHHNHHHHHHHRENDSEYDDDSSEQTEDAGDEDKGIWCAMCGGPIGSKSSYGCKECEFYLHKQCAELPPKIQHHFHPQHPLSLLLPDSPGSRLCQICSGFARPEYSCSICDFWLDIPCASLKPTVQFPYQDHLLHLFDNFPHQRRMLKQLTCEECNKEDDGFIFVCVVPYCSYAVHIHCAPISLPETIKHDCHCHSLTFAECFPPLDESFENKDSDDDSRGDDDDSGEFVCDACEYKRNKHFPVYYCADCEFITHLGCVVSQELPSLLAQYQSNRVVIPSKADRELAELRRKEKDLVERLKRIRQELDVMKDKRDDHISSLKTSSMNECSTHETSTAEQ